MRLDADLVRLLLRAGPFVAARPDIAVSPLPRGQGLGASHSFSGGKSSDSFLSFSLGVSTLGGLVRLWDNFQTFPCPDCSGKAVIVDFGGSFLSGAGKFSEWFCPACGKTFAKTPQTSVVRLGTAIEEASETWPLVRPAPDDATPVLPEKIKPIALKPLFGGILVDAYVRGAIDALSALDAEAADAARTGRTFSATFRIHDGDDAVADVVFANSAGFAHIFRPGSSRPDAFVPVSWDEQFGLWPTLYAAADRLRALAAPKPEND